MFERTGNENQVSSSSGEFKKCKVWTGSGVKATLSQLLKGEKFMLRKSLSLLCHFYKYKKAVIDAFSSLSVVFTTSLWVVCLSVLDYEVQSDNPYIQIIIFVIWFEESSPRDTYHSWNALEWFKIIYVRLRATGRASLLLKYPVLVLRYIYCWQYFFYT